MLWSVLYNALLAAAAVFGVPFYGAKMLLTGKYRRSLLPKLGRLAAEDLTRLAGEPRIWLHAVSVGEVTAAAPIVAALRRRLPGGCLILSVSTETGHEMAKKVAPEASGLIYYPLDLPAVVRRVVKAVRPEVFVPVETELWPNFLRICRQEGAKVVLANGRLSPRSFSRYERTRFFWKEVLKDVSAAGVISAVDAERLLTLGMPSDRVHVLGNAKYDGLAARVSEELRQEMAGRLGIGADEEVLVAGSTHEGEEAAVLRVYGELVKERPGLRLIVVPRHVERGRAVAGLAVTMGFGDVILLSEINGGRNPRKERVIVVDTIGDLFKIYSLGSVCFCGGSLVPKGGQNILEAAAWGKVVLHGPHMADFRQEAELLAAAGAAQVVRDEAELLERVRFFLAAPELRRQKGEAGREFVAASRGAAERHAELILEALTDGFS